MILKNSTVNILNRHTLWLSLSSPGVVLRWHYRALRQAELPVFAFDRLVLRTCDPSPAIPRRPQNGGTLSGIATKIRL